jgi:hypothetical protein
MMSNDIYAHIVIYLSVIVTNEQPPMDDRIAARVPWPLRIRLQAYTKKSGLTMSATMKAALSDYLRERGY